MSFQSPFINSMGPCWIILLKLLFQKISYWPKMFQWYYICDPTLLLFFVCKPVRIEHWKMCFHKNTKKHLNCFVPCQVKLISVTLFTIQIVWKQLMKELTGTHINPVCVCPDPVLLSLSHLLVSLDFPVNVKAKRLLKNHERRKMYNVHSLNSTPHLLDQANQLLSNFWKRLSWACCVLLLSVDDRGYLSSVIIKLLFKLCRWCFEV